MVSHKWLNITEAADYLRVTEAFLQEELKSGKIPYSEFGNQKLLNTDQLDKFLFSIQDVSFPEKDIVKPPGNDVQDFMQKACMLWDDGENFTANLRTKGVSCQFRGEPRLWVFKKKFHVPGEDKGNDLHELIRKALTKYFPQVTGKATVHINRSGFSWQKFESFLRDVKEICNKAYIKEELTTDASHAKAPQESDLLGIYNKCVRLWEKPPDFTIVYGTRGCSARYKNGSRLWFFPNYIRIPTESQNNLLFEETIALKEECFPNLRTKTKISFNKLRIDWPEIEAFIEKVKAHCDDRGV